MTSDFKITPDDIGRIAISAQTWNEDYFDEVHYGPMHWKITSVIDGVYHAIEVQDGIESSRTASFNASGDGIEYDLDALLYLEKWES